ncbi:MAG: hypothetical protein HZB29_10625 [Nitrospinae bacterium]|nr:hypothetical protein [Nitrospinota bacterium]
MKELQIRFTGAKGVFVLAVIAAIIFGKNVFYYRTADPGALAAIRPWIAGEYTRNILDNAKRINEDRRTTSGKLLELDKLDLAFVKAAGYSKPVVCVKISVNGHPPPFGSQSRCFRMNNSALLGWSYNIETGEAGYYMAMFQVW